MSDVSTPTISVVTPTLNQGRFLGRALRSVAAQDFPALEHHVIDGGSSDQTLAVLRAAAHPRLSWISESDRGLSQAVNKGIARSRGDIIAWIGAEDTVLPGAFAAVARFLGAHPEVDVVYGDAEQLDDDDGLLGPYPTEPFDAARLQSACFICQPAAFFRRRCVERYGLLDGRLRICPDYEYWLRLARAGARFAHLPVPLAGWRRRPGAGPAGPRGGAPREIVDMFRRQQGRVPARWLLAYAEAIVGRHVELARHPRGHAALAAFVGGLAGLRFNHAWPRDLGARSSGQAPAHGGAVTSRPAAAAAAPVAAKEPFDARLRRRLGLGLGLLHTTAPRPLRLPKDHDDGSWDGAALRISLVTPVFNQVAYIGQTLQSVLAQRYPGLEYIVMDGGSTDGTVAAIEAVADRLAAFESARDGGQSQAINKGFARATGDVLGWINGDDILLPGALACVARFFARNPDVDVVYGDRIVIDAQGREVGRWTLPGHSDRLLSWVDFVPQESLFWRRRIWERAGAQVDTGFAFAMDWDLLVRFRDCGARMVHVPRYLGAFRVHAEQKTSSRFDDLGRLEMDRIRARCLGYVPSRTRVRLAVLPYLLRSGLVGWSRRRAGSAAS